MKKTLKAILCIVISMMMMVAFAACAPTAAPITTNEESQEPTGAAVTTEETASVEASDAVAAEPVELGFTIADYAIPFQVAIKTAAEARCEELGKGVVVCEFNEAQADPIMQIAAIENFISEGKDAIIINACNTDTLKDVCKKATDAGIPIFGVNRRLGDDIESASYIGCDDVYAGYQLGALTSKMLGGDDVAGKVSLIQGALGTSAQFDRLQGLQDYMKDKNVAWEIISDDSDDWDPAKARSVAQNILQRFKEGEVDCIISQDPFGAVSAVDIVKEAGRNELIGKVACVDMPKEVYAMIKSGEIYGTVLQDPAEQGVMGIDIALQYLTGDAASVEAWSKTELPIVDQDNFTEFSPTW